MSKEPTISLIAVLILASTTVISLASDPQKKAGWRHVSEEVNVDAPGWELYRPPSRMIAEYPVAGVSYQIDCDDINPVAGAIIHHQQIGSTWYDFQKNGSMGRMISVTLDGYRHFSWTYCDQPFTGAPEDLRWVDANCQEPSGYYLGQTHADGGPSHAGYSNTTHLHDGIAAIIHHHRFSGTSVWSSVLTMDDSTCGGLFTRHWDLPDSIPGAPSGEEGMWPKAEVWYDSAEHRDYIHIVMTEGNTTAGVPVMVAYERCYSGLADTLVCESFEAESRQTYKIPVNQPSPGPNHAISHWDSSCSVTPVVVVSPVSERIGVAFFKPTCDGSCNYLCDACYIESMNNGEDWVDGTNWPPPEFNITNFGCTGNERGYKDLSACYDYHDSLHLVYVTCGFDPAHPGSYWPRIARLYHWSKESGVRMISSAIWEGTDPAAHNFNIAKMSVSAMDPAYHPGGDPDSVYLYCIWTQFDTADNAANLYTNGDIYGAASPDGGATWGLAFNLTQTKTPGCAPGECLSEHWPSLAQNLFDGNLHIQYICDRHPGFAGMDDGSQWMSNPVMYLELEPWDPMATPDFAIEAEPDTQQVEAGHSTDYEVILTSLYGFASPCTLTVTGLPPDASAGLDPNPVVPTDSSVMNIYTAETTPVGTYDITITATELVKAQIQHSASVVLLVTPPPPDFSIEAAPDTHEIQAGDSASFDLKLTSLFGFDSPCTLWVSGLPPDASAQLDDIVLIPTDSTVLRMSTQYSTPPDEYDLTVTAQEMGGTFIQHSINVTLVLLHSDTLWVTAYSPVDLIVTDPVGDSIGLEFNTIEDASYDTLLDVNEDGDNDDQVTIPHCLVGDYLIRVISEPDAAPGDSYSLGIRINGSAETPPLTAPAPPQGESDDYVYSSLPYLRGDANGDNVTDLGDAIFELNYLFKSGPAPDPLELGDVNCDGIVDIGDAIYLLNYLFKGGDPPCS